MKNKDKKALFSYLRTEFFYRSILSKNLSKRIVRILQHKLEIFNEKDYTIKHIVTEKRTYT
ncbi:hypothetical protein HMPREF3219_0200996 [Streptococcus salivarius]|nr:hypothetical protein HMPREF3219_0200996 [Streptococcus salivarius]